MYVCVFSNNKRITMKKKKKKKKKPLLLTSQKHQLLVFVGLFRDNMQHNKIMMTHLFHIQQYFEMELYLFEEKGEGDRGEKEERNL